MNTTGLFNLSWQRYLNLLFLLLTVGFLTSGVITLIAANLDYFYVLCPGSDLLWQ